MDDELKNQCVQDDNGDCQHIIAGAAGLSIIPSGTHYFGGRTVLGAPSTEQVVIARQSDDIADDLVEIVGRAFEQGRRAKMRAKVADKDQIGELVKAVNESLMESLVMYITDRDQHVLNHGIAVGRKEPATANTSDGYHTFRELYEFRMLYNAALFNTLAVDEHMLNTSKGMSFRVQKSKRHHEGELCFGGGWFIVIAYLPTGQISNHYPLKDWDLFSKVPEQERADKWDGHTPADAAKRLREWLGGEKT